MSVRELTTVQEFAIVTMPDGDIEVTGAYCGDLLSWVMGRAKADDAWITIMTNANIVAVASLSDVSVILLAEGVELSDDVKVVAEAKGVNILVSSLPIYETAVKLSGLLV